MALLLSEEHDYLLIVKYTAEVTCTGRSSSCRYEGRHLGNSTSIFIKIENPILIKILYS